MEIKVHIKGSPPPLSPTGGSPPLFPHNVPQNHSARRSVIPIAAQGAFASSMCARASACAASLKLKRRTASRPQKGLLGTFTLNCGFLCEVRRHTKEVVFMVSVTFLCSRCLFYGKLSFGENLGKMAQNGRSEELKS